MAEISLQNVSKVYRGGVCAVTGVSLDIADGEFVILVGPSGCGKSTVLRMIAGLEDVTGGRISIGGAGMNDVPPKDRNVSMVFQSYALYPHMTVFQNMAYGLKLRRTPRAETERRVMEAATVLGIERLLERKPRALSGGERQRVALGRAMVRDPAVFLFDEPLSNLDAKLRASMRAEIKKLHERLGATFVYVTHDQIEAMTMGDRIVVMKDGVIQQTDTPERIYNSPANVFTAGFIGSPQMNLIDGTLTEAPSGAAVRTAGGDIALTGGIPAEYIGRAVTAGIRPEALTLCGEGDSGALRCTAELFESLGSEAYLYASLGGERLTARVAVSAAIPSGSPVFLGAEPEAVRLFDAASGEAIDTRREVL